MKVYLAGFIQGSKIDECKAWRLKIAEHYATWKGGTKYPITWLDPLNGKDLATITPDGLKSSTPRNSIVHRDYKCINDCDLVVANMDTFGESRPLTGTICELAWAWDKHKPIIMITDDAKYYMHPFLDYFASAIVSSVDELLEKKLINYFYKGTVDALYT